MKSFVHAVLLFCCALRHGYKCTPSLCKKRRTDGDCANITIATERKNAALRNYLITSLYVAQT